MTAPDKIYIDRGPHGGWMHRHKRMSDTVAEYTRTDLIPNAAYVAGLEEALREIRDEPCISSEGNSDIASVALSARPDAPDTRVVTVAQLEEWYMYFDESTATRQCREIRAIIGEVKL